MIIRRMVEESHLPQHDEEWANVAIFKVFLNWSESIKYTMKKTMSNVRTSLYRVEKLRIFIALQVFDYSQSGSVEGGTLNCL